MHARLRCRLAICALAACAALAAPGAAGAVAPAIDGLEVVSVATAPGPDGANAWGGHQPRVVRTAAGVFTVYATPGRDPFHRGWALAQQTTAGWRTIASGEAGHEAPSLLAAPGGELHVIAWPTGLPRMWTIARVAGSWLVRSAAWVPGDWQQGDWPYAAAAIGPAGQVYLLKSDYYTDQVPGGDMRFAVGDPVSGIWSFGVTPTRYRFCYAWLMPSADGATVVATRAVRWHALGYKQPASDPFPYVYDAIRVWHMPLVASSGLVPGRFIRRETPDRKYRAVKASAAQPDVFQDTSGRVHVLYVVRGPSTRGYTQWRHAVLVAGRVVADVRLPSTIEYGKVVENARGQLYVIGTAEGSSRLYVYPSVSGDGTELGEPTTLSLKGHRLRYPGFTAADPRSGTPPADRVDAVYASGRDSRAWVHFTLSLP
jgi:hypothetical protein